MSLSNRSSVVEEIPPWEDPLPQHQNGQLQASQQNNRRRNANLRRPELNARILKRNHCRVIFLFWIVAILLCIIVYRTTLPLKDFSSQKYLWEHKVLVEDWSTQPYVDIKIVEAKVNSVTGFEENSCPEEYEIVISRDWQGTKDLCLNETGFPTEFANFPDKIDSETNFEDVCPEGHTFKEGIYPRKLPIINNKVVCGKRGGKPFVDVIRPDQKTGKCPGELRPCSLNSPTQNTICVKSEDKPSKCPIVDLQVAGEAQVGPFKQMGYQITELGFTEEINETTRTMYIAFSKDISMSDYQPLIETELSTFPRCSQENYATQILSQPAGIEILDFSIEREQLVEKCESQPWRSGQNQRDSRYFRLAWLPYWELQAENKVYEQMNQTYPAWFEESEKNINLRRNFYMSIFIKKSYSWSLSCDNDSTTMDRRQFYDTILEYEDHFYDPQESYTSLKQRRNLQSMTTGELQNRINERRRNELNK